MSDRRPDCVYGILVKAGRVFLRDVGGRPGLPGGTFPPMADHRKHELRALLWEQLGIDAERMWAQGAFDYQDPTEERPRFSGFYSVWEWEGDVPVAAGWWLDEAAVLSAEIPASLRVLLLSVLSTQATRTA